jgi:hypothetical protein
MPDNAYDVKRPQRANEVSYASSARMLEEAARGRRDCRRFPARLSCVAQRDGEAQPIWWRNAVFQPAREDFSGLDARMGSHEDEAIVRRVRRFMTRLVAKSLPVPEIPGGPHRRLPHRINYLHGA